MHNDDNGGEEEFYLYLTFNFWVLICSNRVLTGAEAWGLQWQEEETEQVQGKSTLTKWKTPYQELIKHDLIIWSVCVCLDNMEAG